MRLENGVVFLEEVVGYSPNTDCVRYTDTSGNVIVIPLKVIVRLYEGTKYDVERRGVDWKSLCDSLFEQTK